MLSIVSAASSQQSAREKRSFGEFLPPPSITASVKSLRISLSIRSDSDRIYFKCLFSSICPISACALTLIAATGVFNSWLASEMNCFSLPCFPGRLHHIVRQIEADSQQQQQKSGADQTHRSQNLLE